jgi:hypothetical protein
MSIFSTGGCGHLIFQKEGRIPNKKDAEKRAD